LLEGNLEMTDRVMNLTLLLLMIGFLLAGIGFVLAHTHVG